MKSPSTEAPVPGRTDCGAKPTFRTPSYCGRCGVPLPSGSKFCNECGAAVVLAGCADPVASRSDNPTSSSMTEPNIVSSVTVRPSSLNRNLLWIVPLVAFVGWSIYPWAGQLNSELPTEAARVPGPETAPTTPTVRSYASDISTESPRTEVLNASEVAREYMSNEIRADAKYRGRILTLQGQVNIIDAGHHVSDDPGSTWMNTPSLGISNSIISVGARCHFSEGDAPRLANVQNYQMVTITGKCLGYDGRVILTDSKIVGEGN